MATYYVTFRIHDQSAAGRSYQQRYDALMENLREEGEGFWTETTSFVLASSDLSTDTFAARAIKGLSSQYDRLLVVDPDDNSACCFGAIEHFEVLKSFFPRIKKLG